MERAKHGSEDGNAHGAEGGGSPWWKYSTIALSILLVLSLIQRKSRAPAEEKSATPQPLKKEAI
jgi:hypothetical protein